MATEKRNPLGEFFKFVKFMAEKASGNIQKQDIKTGDTISFLFPQQAVNYLVNKATDKTLGNDKIIPESLVNFLADNSAVFIDHLEKDKPFNCGHCNKVHYHDCVIYYPLLDLTLYATFDDLILSEKLEEKDLK